MSDHAAIVLAAGASARLGRPKQLLLRCGVPLVRHIVDVVASSAPVRLVVVLGAQREAVEAALAAAPCELVFNAGWAAGLASSLGAAAAALRDHGGPTLVATCDQAALTRAHLDALLALARDAPSGCAATMHSGAPGVPAVVSPAMLQRTRRLHGDRGFGPALAALEPASLGRLVAPELALDIDDADALARAIAGGLVDPPA